MISFLHGIICAKEMTQGSTDKLILDVGGVGFELNVARSTLASLGQVGEEVVVHTALSIRENEWTMYGFASSSEKEMFILLQSVSGVGPKSALALVGIVGAGNRNRTGTALSGRGILSPMCLPVSPSRRPGKNRTSKRI